MLVPYEDLEESKEATFERKSQSQALELQGSFDPFSQGKKRHFLWKGHDLIKKNKSHPLNMPENRGPDHARYSRDSSRITSFKVSQGYRVRWWSLKQGQSDRGWRDGSAAKDICSFRGLGFSSQLPECVLQPSVAPVPGDPLIVPSSDLTRHQTSTDACGHSI